MEKLTVLTSVAVPLPIDNCDTDQIMPKQFLRGIDKKGLAKGTFFNLRCHPDGSPKMECVFNRPGFAAASILVAGPNFGCGSSREHAVWGLMQMGIRVVIATGFGEIFYSNCFNNGLLAAKVTSETADELFAYLQGDEARELTIDLVNRTIVGGDRTWRFEVGERHRVMLLEGLDMVGATLKDMDLIKAFKQRHEAQYPWMAGLAAKAKRALSN
ncbi:MAG: 3-isopropylmalate dehydratase small subunit [Duodenibacillus sp.]|nr:3-isopropylmalate dehydratase small subunit [Duodenibacillus sp.]